MDDGSQIVVHSHPLRVVVQRNGSSVTPLAASLVPTSSISRYTLLLLLLLAEDFGRCSSNAITITKLAFPAMLLTLIHLLSYVVCTAGNYYQ